MSDTVAAYAPYEVRHSFVLDRMEEELLVLSRGFKPDIDQMINLIEKIEQRESNGVRAWVMGGDKSYEAQRMREILTLRRLTAFLHRCRAHRQELKRIFERKA